MNIFFLTLSEITDINHRGIYTDLMRKFRDEGHRFTIFSPVERRLKQKTKLKKQKYISILNVKTLNILNTTSKHIYSITPLTTATYFSKNSVSG